jgi:hypothetical protein
MLLSQSTALLCQPQGSKIIVPHMHGKVQFKNKELIHMVSNGKFLTYSTSLLFCFNIFFNSNERLDKMNETFVEFLSDHKLFLLTA